MWPFGSRKTKQDPGALILRPIEIVMMDGSISEMTAGHYDVHMNGTLTIYDKRPGVIGGLGPYYTALRSLAPNTWADVYYADICEGSDK